MSFVFRVFFGNRQVRPWLVLVCLLLSALAEALSIGSALPALSLLSGGTNSNSSPLNLRIHDAIASLGIPTSFESLIVVMMALMILKSVLAFAVLSYVGVAAANVSIALRKRLIEAIFRVRWSYFSGQSAGTIANILANEAGRAGDAYLLSAQFVAALVQNAGYVLIAVLIDWRLALIGVAASFVLGASMGGLMRTTKKAGRQQSVSTASLTTYLMDALANIKALKSMQRYEPVFTGIATTLKKLRRALVRRELSKAAVSQAADALGAVLIGLFLLAAHAIWKTPLPEMLVSAIVYLQIVSVTSKLLKQYQQYVQLEAAYQKAEEVVLEVEAQPEPRDGTGTVRLAEGCRFEHVNFAYDDRPVIFDATFDIPAAAVTVLSGLSGSGKTTLLDLLIGLYQPQAGRILVDGVDLADLDIAAWRRGIGYVPQELVLFHASIRDNITLRDPAIGDDAILAALRMAGGGEFIAALPRGLDTDVGEMGSKLSGGERQRISLARALVAAPRLLILDEVTSALDPETEAEIVANIAALRGRYTIVAITHRPAWTAIADRLYQVSEGRVSELQPAVAAAS